LLSLQQTFREIGELLEVFEDDMEDLVGNINIDDNDEGDDVYGDEDSDEYDLHDEL